MVGGGRHQVPVRTAVMLMQERAQLVECLRPGVDFVGTQPWRLLDAILDPSAPTLDARACRDIVRLVERDHSFHAKRRR